MLWAGMSTLQENLWLAAAESSDGSFFFEVSVWACV